VAWVIHVDMRKMFRTRGIVQQWNRLVKEVVDSPQEVSET